MINILISCAGRRRYIVDYLENIQLINKIVITDASELVSSRKKNCIFYKTSMANDVKYLGEIKEICLKEKIDIILSLNDLELPVITKAKKDFEDIGVFVLHSDFDKIKIAMDKYLTYKFLSSNEILTPKTYICLIKVKEDLDKDIISFPLVVKPRYGSGSFSINIVHSYDELLQVTKLVTESVTNSNLNFITQNDEYFIVQEYIHYDNTIIEYGCDILNDLKGDFVHATIKKKLVMRSGETDKCISSFDQNIYELCKRVSKSFSHVGNLDIDILYDGLHFYILELNPRFGGGYPFTHELGNNYIEYIINDFLNISNNTSPFKNLIDVKLVKSDSVYVI